MRLILLTVLLASTFAINNLDAQDHYCNDCDDCQIGRRSGQQYCPEDPQTRSRFWLRQTGHFGWFYNCDCEENKRYSPFICWKKSASPFAGFRIRECIKCDWLNIRQRIIDGSGCCCGRRLFRVPWRSCHCESNQ